MMSVQIDTRRVAAGQPTLVIAEIGVNHDGSLDRALELVYHAAASGADAVKLQVFHAESLVHPSADFAEYQTATPSPSMSTEGGEGDKSASAHGAQLPWTDPATMLRQLELSADELGHVVQTIRDANMIPLATPFSPQDVATIARLDLPAVKIASPDLLNRPLLERAASLGRPLIVSTGASTIQEVKLAVSWLRQWGAQFVLMHCVSSYPTPADQAHLCWIGQLSQFGVPVGWSDHTTELLAGAMSIAAGACVIEKHLTYDRSAAGPDHAASADPEQFAEYVRIMRVAETLCGSGSKHVLAIEQDVRNVSRQSLVLTRDVAAGQVIGEADLTVQRPGSGIAAAEIHAATGKAARSPLRRGTLLQWDMLTDAA